MLKGSTVEIPAPLPTSHTSAASLSEKSSLRLAISGGEDRLVVHVRGELDSPTASCLRECIEKLVVRGHRRVILDIAEMRFSEFTAVALLSGGLRRLHQAGVEVVLHSPTPGTLALLQRIGLGNLTIVDSDTEDLSENRGSDVRHVQRFPTVCLEERHAVLEMIDNLHVGTDPQIALEQVNFAQ